MNHSKNRFGEIAEEDSEESSDPESEKGVRIQLKKLDESGPEKVGEENKITEKAGEENKIIGTKVESSKMAPHKGDADDPSIEKKEEEIMNGVEDKHVK